MSVRISIIAANSLLGGLQSAFSGCKINIYSGSQPASPELAKTGTLLATISLGGTATGLTWDTPADNTMTKPAAADWSGTAVATGTAGWCRVYESGDADPGAASTTVDRVDMVCTRTGSTECILSTLSLVLDGSISIDSAEIVMPVA